MLLEMPDDVVVGGGVCGLTLAYELSKRRNVLVVEREGEVGGLARTFRYGGFSFDIGPHRFHTTDAEVLDFINSVLKEDKTLIGRKSGVHLDGKYFDWPLRPATLASLPLGTTLAAVKDLFTRRSGKIESFEDYIEAKYGHTLYDVFFRGYTAKFVLTDPALIHPLWSMTGIDRAIIDEKQQFDSLIGLIKTTFLSRNVNTRFIYPPKGIATLPDKLAKGISGNGSAIMTNAEVSGMDIDGDVIRSVEVNGEKVGLKNLYWTAPITTALELIGAPKPDLEYLSTIIYNIELRGGVRVPYQWCYFRDDDVPFVRSSTPTLFSESMAPMGCTSLCIEVSCRSESEIWANPERLKDGIVEGMERTGLARRTDVSGIHIERIRDTYPLYKINFQQEVKKSMERLGAIKNLTLLGRCGKFWYNNMDHSIKDALAASRSPPSAD
jgi:protoporphyrinogen oxidase